MHKGMQPSLCRRSSLNLSFYECPADALVRKGEEVVHATVVRTALFAVPANLGICRKLAWAVLLHSCPAVCRS